MMTANGEVPPTGKSYKAPFVAVFELSGTGLITACREYYDTASLRRSARLDRLRSDSSRIRITSSLSVGSSPSQDSARARTLGAHGIGFGRGENRCR